MFTQHALTLQNGSTVVVQEFAPAAATCGTVIIPSAMGVAQAYYRHFAQWLASQGYAALTFDYRGIGLSAPARLRGFEMDLDRWAREDCARVIEFAKAQRPQLPLYWIGHSLGAQLVGLIPNREHIDRVITVAAGSGYWLEMSWQTRRMVWWLWFIVVPLALRLVGYFPGKRLRKVGNLPRGVMAQWRRWCLNREYVVGAEGDAVRAAFASVHMPMLSLSFTDDEMMSEQSTRSLHGLYAGAPIEYRRIAPRQVGAGRIGHFGFFRREFEQSLWPLVPQWLSGAGQR